MRFDIRASWGYPRALFHTVRKDITAAREKLRAQPRKCRKVLSSRGFWMAGAPASRLPADGPRFARHFVRGQAGRGPGRGRGQRSGKIHAPANPHDTIDSDSRPCPGLRFRCGPRAREGPPPDWLSHRRGRLLLFAPQRERKPCAVCRPQ